MNYQEKVKNFCNDFNLDSGVEFKVLDLISEVGEFSKEVLKATDYGKEKVDSNDELKMEIGDIFYSLITIANSLDLNLDEALDEVLEHNKKRLQKLTE